MECRYEHANQSSVDSQLSPERPPLRRHQAAERVTVEEVVVVDVVVQRCAGIDVSKRDAIVRMRGAADLAAAERPAFQVMRTESKAFADSVEARRHPTSPFYFRKPPPVLDICGVPVGVRQLAR